MDGSIFIYCIIVSIAENCTLSRRLCGAYRDNACDSFGTADIMVTTSSFLFKDNYSLTFSERENLYLEK